MKAYSFLLLFCSISSSLLSMHERQRFSNFLALNNDIQKNILSCIIENELQDKPIKTLKSTGLKVMPFVYLSNKDSFASGSIDGSIKIWDYSIDRKYPIAILKGHTERIRHLVCLSENTIASTSYDRTVKIWDTISGKCLRTLLGHVGPVLCLANFKELDPTGIERNVIISGGADGLIKVWNGSNGNCIRTMRDSISWINSLIYLGDDLIASAGYDRTINIWNIKTGKCLNVLRDHVSEIIKLTNIKPGVIASESNDNTVNIWDLNKVKRIKSIIKKYFDIEYPLILKLCLLDSPLTERERCEIKELFSEDGQFDKVKFNKWIDTIDKNFRTIVKNKIGL